MVEVEDLGNKEYRPIWNHELYNKAERDEPIHFKWNGKSLSGVGFNFQYGKCYEYSTLVEGARHFIMRSYGKKRTIISKDWNGYQGVMTENKELIIGRPIRHPATGLVIADDSSEIVNKHTKLLYLDDVEKDVIPFNGAKNSLKKKKTGYPTEVLPVVEVVTYEVFLSERAGNFKGSIVSSLNDTGIL